jgi:hypothetical protein
MAEGAQDYQALSFFVDFSGIIIKSKNEDIMEGKVNEFADCALPVKVSLLVE